ncbi:MAG: histidine kinase, partial [Bacteroidota bacterium]
KLSAEKQQLRAQRRQQYSYFLGSLGFVLLLLGVAVALYYRKKQSLAKTAAQALLIEQKLWRAQMNPHFIFNSLNSIKRLYVEGRTEKANNFLSDFSCLLRQILERSNQATIPIEQEVDFLRLYLELEKRRLGDKLSYSIHFDSADFSFDDTIPSLLLQPLVENSIWHGILKTERQGQIEVRLSREDDCVRCLVEDNGIGYYASQQEKSIGHQSKGLTLVRERLGEHGHLLIRELTDNLGHASGTQVELTIPQL